MAKIIPLFSKEFLDELFTNLQKGKFFDATAAKTKTEYLYGNKLAAKAEETETKFEDIIPLHTDLPTNEDMLGRKQFAKHLAIPLKNIHSHNEGAFLLHIHGQWGSGKTSLLKLLEDELRHNGDKQDTQKDQFKKWIVIWNGRKIFTFKSKAFIQYSGGMPVFLSLILQFIQTIFCQLRCVSLLSNGGYILKSVTECNGQIFVFLINESELKRSKKRTDRRGKTKGMGDIQGSK